MRRLVGSLILAAWVSMARPAAAQPDARGQAAEHFALAQSAEARKDWRAAIAEYEEAFRLAPHASVLFNIAVDYERLTERRTAVRYFLRYLDGSPEAEDRESVLRRIEGLRQAPSAVTFSVTPAGATVLVDGRALGAAPLTVTLEPGTHQVAAEQDGRRSMTRQIVLEYGDPMTVGLDLYALPGLLTVDSDQAGAEVRVDGALVGHTPFVGQIPSGEHQILVSLPGYQSVQRAVTVPPQGSAQIRAPMGNPIGVVGGPAASSRASSGKFLIGTGYGVMSGTEEGLRYVFDLGYRGASDRFDLGAIFGFFGTEVGGGVGAEGRLYLSTSALRPYLRGAALLGGGDAGTVAEVGAGLLYGGGSTVIPLGFEYYFEIDLQLRGNDPTADDTSGGGGGGGLALRPAGAVIFPVVFGLRLRIGG